MTGAILADLHGADVLAAGAVLWRRAGAGIEVALVHRPRYDDWSLPKGKLDRGETLPFAAVREVGEETGHAARLGAHVGDVCYAVAEGRKLVRYWAAESRGGSFAPGDETDELRWLTPPAAEALLTYTHDVDILRRCTPITPPDAVVVLVRHAKAGNRIQWDGDDDLRPLSSTGHDQARHVTALLPLFGPDRVVSAPPVRCRDTVAPFAATAGLQVADEPLFGEEGFWADPDAGVARLLKLAAEPGVTVISSQGGVIPAVVGTLAGGLPGVVAADVPARKASTWVLTFRAGSALSADYYPRPSG